MNDILMSSVQITRWVKNMVKQLYFNIKFDYLLEYKFFRFKKNWILYVTVSEGSRNSIVKTCYFRRTDASLHIFFEIAVKTYD